MTDFDRFLTDNGFVVSNTEPTAVYYTRTGGHGAQYEVCVSRTDKPHQLAVYACGVVVYGRNLADLAAVRQAVSECRFDG